MAVYIIVGIVAYLIGSISFSVIISKRVAGFDVREKGSGNAGATNMLRSVGKKAAVLTLLCDALKGVLAIILVPFLNNSLGSGSLFKLSIFIFLFFKYFFKSIW